MNVLGLDIGSSSVKAGIVRGGKIVGAIARADFPTKYDGARAEVDPSKLLGAVQRAISDLGPRARRADALNFSVMCPAWVAMDGRGKALTPLITHQDRRSIEQALKLEKRVGRKRFLHIAGNRPFPGGISATTVAWFAEHQPGTLKRADLLGHLNTFLHRQLSGARVIDPGNASFTGLYETVRQGGWSDVLLEAVGIAKSKLPAVRESDRIAGCVHRAAASRFGLTEGMPALVGMVDTSSGMMFAGARIGQLLNVSGSTDVLALCTDRPRPHEKLLTRALGVGRKWMSVATLAAGGSTVTWIKAQMYADMPRDAFYRLVAKLAGSDEKPTAARGGGVRFEPYLAGERTSIEQKTASFTGLTLASTRDDLLRAAVDALAQASGARLRLLETNRVHMLRGVMTSGGAGRSLHAVLHRDWPGRWQFHAYDEVSLKGLSMVAPQG